MIQEDIDFFESKGVKLNDPYTIFGVSEGILIAECLETKEEILKFNSLSFSEQKKLVPISDEHSGGTFNLAIKSAIIYLEKLKQDKRDHKINHIINN